MNSLEGRLKYRRKRREDFDLFMSRSKNEFRRIADADPRARDFEQLYALCIAPGGRSGGQDKRCVEVFFGNRPVDKSERITFENGKFQRHDVIQGESGATLQYYRQNDDRVVVFLHPAGAWGDKSSGTSVIIDVIKDTNVLSDPSKLEQHWRYLIVMMETSSIDGIPTLSDRILMSWLRLTRYEVKDNKANRQRMWTWLGIGVAFFFTVGLSGWALGPVKDAFSVMLNLLIGLGSAAKGFIGLLVRA